MEMATWIIAVATIVLAITTSVYTFGTILLWKQTRDAFKLNFILGYYQNLDKPFQNLPFQILFLTSIEELLKKVFPKEYKELIGEKKKENVQP